MLNRPRFKPHLHVATVPDEGVFVLSGAKQALLRGRLYQLVTPFVDGRSADEICDQLAERASAAEVYYTLSQLERKGFLTEADDNTLTADAAWWSSQEIDHGTAASRLSQNRVAVHGFGVDCEPLEALLAASGVGTGDDGALAVVAVDHYLRTELAAQNDAALAGGRPWLLVRPAGNQLWLGPLFRPGVTGCWKCLAERLRANRPVESYLQERQTLAQPPVVDGARTAASLHVAWGLTASAVASWVVRGELPDFEGKVREFDLRSWQTTIHHLAKLPYCSACGHGANGHHGGNGVSGANGDHRHSRPLVLESRKKSFVRDGGHRVVHPDETIKRFGHHVSSITGAVSMLQRASPAGDGCMHVYLAGNNLARRHHSLAQLRGDLRNMSAGKGTTDAQAKASGLCEGLERHSGVFRGDEPRRTARLADLGTAGIDLNDCLLFSRKQFQERDLINAKNSPYNFVPLPFDAEAEIEWTPAWSLGRQSVRYLPTAFCYYDYPQFEDKAYCIACSNGCAAGNTVEEAILQGFLELVERDSVALWWYNRAPRPGVDLDSFNEPYLDELAEFLATRRREMRVLDLTADLGIPVFAAWSRRVDAASEQIVLGFGAHLDARIALLRAVTEMNQMLSYLLHVPPERATSDTVTDAETAHWLKTATADNQPYLLPAAGVSLRTASDHATAWSDDVAEDVHVCQRRLDGVGLELLVVDQTRPEIGLPVVKVVVPGLRHFWARFAPGRLYDVPVQLGWLDQRLAEEDLNPIPMFL
jgi:bacteriocin biosynthesis cyclodehydratase domain-containing protein